MFLLCENCIDNVQVKEREEILVSLRKCVKEAVKNIYKIKNKTDEEANNAGGEVFSFGSSSLSFDNIIIYYNTSFVNTYFKYF